MELMFLLPLLALALVFASLWVVGWLNERRIDLYQYGALCAALLVLAPILYVATARTLNEMSALACATVFLIGLLWCALLSKRGAWRNVRVNLVFIRYRMFGR